MTESTQDQDLLEELGDARMAEALAPTLRLLERPTELLLFVGASCPRCPHMLRSAATVALASDKVVLDVVEASSAPELLQRYEVAAVPTTVVDDELIMAGIVAPDELAMRLVERQGPEQARVVFTGLVNGGHVEPAAERLADGRATEVFLSLWAEADAEKRLTLMRVAQASELYNPFGLEPVVEGLEQGLEPGGPLAEDEDRRLDTLELLERLADDED